jgi:large subunit ribosomal protein L31
MKAGIHPNYQNCRVHCACGNDFLTMATKPEIKVEICSECHPFFTGEQRYVDTAGRVDKFRRRVALQAEKAAAAAKKEG